MSTFKSDDIYEVQAVRKACDLLKAFQAPDEVLRLGDLVSQQRRSACCTLWSSRGFWRKCAGMATGR
jgi:hypothetical protein